MKNIMKLYAIATLLFGITNVSAASYWQRAKKYVQEKFSKPVIVTNTTQVPLYIALVMTDKKKSPRYQTIYPVESGSEYGKILGTLNVPEALHPGESIEFKNFTISNDYDRALFVSAERESLRRAIEVKGKMDPIQFRESGFTRVGSETQITIFEGKRRAKDIDLKFSNSNSKQKIRLQADSYITPLIK